MAPRPTPTREDRFVALYREHYPKVLAYCRRRLGDADAADAVSDTFISAWRHIDRLPAEPLPWLYRLAHHAILNQRRGIARWLRLQSRARNWRELKAVSDPAAMTEMSDQLRSGWLHLSETDREVLRLAAWEGLAGGQLAAALGCSEDAARVRLHRARLRLSRILAADSSPRCASPMHETSTVRSA